MQSTTAPVNVTDAWKYDPEYHRMADFLGLDAHDRNNLDTAQKIALLRDWGGLKGKKDSPEEAMSTLQKLRHDIGTPQVGLSLINELYQHVRLDMDRSSKKKEGQKAEGNVVRPEEKEKHASKKESGVGSIIAKTTHAAVQNAIQGNVKNVVKSVLSDKKYLEKAVASAVAESMK